MKAKTYYRWIGKRVRLRGAKDARIGTVVAPGGFNTWWTVEWPNGKQTKTPERELEVVEDEPRQS
jgi:hypothetical protein